MDRRSFIRHLAGGATLAALPLAATAARAPAAADPAPVLLRGERLRVLRETVERLVRVRRVVGYGNFNLLGFDAALVYARRYPAIGAFRRVEVDFLEEMYFADARAYGFMGAKVFDAIDTRIAKREVLKVPASGHYVFRGASDALYRRLRREVGSSLVLTSGVRGVVKQMHLFLAKALETGGDLSVASRSLAPPGHSYHGIGDFDVGKRGLGAGNFTEAFARTEEYHRLGALGYVQIRYPNGNPYGVRFEPWHIKVV